MLTCLMDCFAKCKLNFHSMILGYIVPSKVHVFLKKGVPVGGVVMPERVIKITYQELSAPLMAFFPYAWGSMRVEISLACFQ